MEITLQRTCGDKELTLSRMIVRDGFGTELMNCEAREPKFADYVQDEPFRGSSQCCLPAGEFELIPLPTAGLSPMTLTVKKCTGHRGAKIGYDLWRTTRANFILIDEAEFKYLEAVTYQCFARGENFLLIVKNEFTNEYYCKKSEENPFLSGR